jgi:hypothetical protein
MWELGTVGGSVRRLTPVDVPGLGRLTLPRLRSGKLPRGTASVLTADRRIARWHLRELTVWDPWTGAARDVRLPFAPVALDVQADRIACVRESGLLSSAQIAVRDFDGRELWSAKLEKGETTARFSPNGDLWTLTGRTLRLFGNGKELATPLALNEQMQWLLGESHPSRSAIAMHAGAGQDDAYFRVASREGETLVATAPDSGVCFGGWSPSGASYATLPHHGSLLRLCDTATRREQHRHELDEVLEALDDATKWDVVMTSETVALVPTNEGRLLSIDLANGEATELWLDGDDRNWDLSMVLPGPDRQLLVWRYGDEEFGAWRLPG